MPWTVSASGNKSTTSAATPTTFVLASPGSCTIPNTAAAGDKVVFTGGTVPTGVTLGTTYYVLATSLSSSSFQFSLTPGGTAINTSTSAGSGTTATFEHILDTDTTNATYWAEIDLTSMVNKDGTELRVYDSVLASGALGQIWKGAYSNVQINSRKATPFIPEDQQIQFAVKALANVYTATVTFTGSGSANITAAANLLVINDVVQFTAGTSLPPGFSTLTNYFVITVGSPFTVSLTLGGSAVVATSTTGVGTQTVTRIGHTFPFKVLRQ